MRRRQKWTKAQSQRHHAKTRAGQRYGVVITKDVRRSLVAAIQTGRDAFHVSSQSRRTSLWDVKLSDGRWARVVYDKQRKEIVTFLPASDAEYSGVLQVEDEIQSGESAKALQADPVERT